MKKVCTVLLLCLCLSACAVPGKNTIEATPAATASMPPSSPVATPDPETEAPGNSIPFQSAQIEHAAREALSMPEGPLTAEMLESITELSVAFQTFTGVTPIWPKTLPFPPENPVDVSELAYFLNLEKLSLVGMNNGLETLPALPKLSALRLFWHENIHSSYALDLSPLVSFSGLKTVEVSGYFPQNSAALAPLPLESVSLYFSNITDLSPFAMLTNLRALKLSNFRGYNGMTFSADLSPLLALPKLETLAVGAAWADLTVLAARPGLSALSLVLPEGADFTFLAHMPNLTHLAVNSPSAESLSPESLPAGLLSLVLLGGEVRDFSALLPSLECYFLPDGTVSENYGAYPLPYDYDRLGG